MKTSKIVSIVAMVTLGLVAYIWVGSMTFEFFQPFSQGVSAAKHAGHDHAVSPGDKLAVLFSLGWPLTWSVWGTHYVATHYTLAVFVSLFLLVFTWPIASCATQLTVLRKRKKTHRVEHLKQLGLKEAELDDFLKGEGVEL